MKTVADTLGVARSNLAEAARGQRRPRQPYRKAGDAELVTDLRRLVDERPTYGYPGSRPCSITSVAQAASRRQRQARAPALLSLMAAPTCSAVRAADQAASFAASPPSDKGFGAKLAMGGSGDQVAAAFRTGDRRPRQVVLRSCLSPCKLGKIVAMFYSSNLLLFATFSC